jgi:hypothetical protein
MSFYREVSGFYRICKEDSSDLRPQDDRERFINKHQRKSSLIFVIPQPAKDLLLPNFSLDVFILI